MWSRGTKCKVYMTNISSAAVLTALVIWTFYRSKKKRVNLSCGQLSFASFNEKKEYCIHKYLNLAYFETILDDFFTL